MVSAKVSVRACAAHSWWLRLTSSPVGGSTKIIISLRVSATLQKRSRKMGLGKKALMVAKHPDWLINETLRITGWNCWASQHFPSILFLFVLTSIHPCPTVFIYHSHTCLWALASVCVSGVFGDLLGCSLTSSLTGSKLFQLGLTPSVCMPTWHGNHTNPHYKCGGNSTLVRCHRASFQRLCQDSESLQWSVHTMQGGAILLQQ